MERGYLARDGRYPARQPAIEVPAPTLGAQRTFHGVQAGVAALKAEHAVIRQASPALLPATLKRLFSGNP